MRYTVTKNTLMINGEFEALSSGINSGRKHVTTLFNHTINPKFFNNTPPEHYTEKVAHKHGIPAPYFGLLTAVEMKYLQIITDEYLTAFITAGITNPSPFKISDQQITHTTYNQAGTDHRNHRHNKHHPHNTRHPLRRSNGKRHYHSNRSKRTSTTQSRLQLPWNNNRRHNHRIRKTPKRQIKYAGTPAPNSEKGLQRRLYKELGNR